MPRELDKAPSSHLALTGVLEYPVRSTGSVELNSSKPGEKTALNGAQEIPRALDRAWLAVLGQPGAAWGWCPLPLRLGNRVSGMRWQGWGC